MLIGDLVKEVTTKLGIKSCIPCQARQAKMNQTQIDLMAKIKGLFSSGSQGSGPQPGV